MSKRITIKYIGRFATKSQWKDALKELLNRSPEGQPILAPNDVALLSDTLSQHGDVRRKIGCGVSGFTTEVRSGTWATSRCFAVIRVDGSIDTFSMDNCITPQTPQELFHEVMRTELAQVLGEAKREAFRLHPRKCRECKEPLTSWDAEIDHVAPREFVVLVKEWLEINCINWESLGVFKDQLGNRVLMDRGIAASWLNHHDQTGKLRFLCKKCNLATRRARKPKADRE